MTEVVAKPVKIDLRRDNLKLINELRDTRTLMLNIRGKLQAAVVEAHRAQTAQEKYAYQLARLEVAVHKRLARIEDLL
jgi:hypothetical protein